MRIENNDLPLLFLVEMSLKRDESRVQKSSKLNELFQLKEDVMNDRLSVSPEMAILLASLVVQGKRLTRIFRYLQKFLIIYLVFFSGTRRP